MIKLDGRKSIVRHTDDPATVPSGNDNLDVDATSPQRDFRADEISEVSEDGPVELPSDVDDGSVGVPSDVDDGPVGVPSDVSDGSVEVLRDVDNTPSALKKGHSFREPFQSDTDGDSDSESEQAVRGMEGRDGRDTTTSMVRQVHCSFVLMRIDGTSVNSNHRPPGTPIGMLHFLR